MDELISQSLSYPTVVFSIGLVLSVMYWLLVVAGAVDAHSHHHGPDLDTPDVDHGHHHPDGDGLLDTLGLGGVPVMLPLSFIFLFGWATSILAIHFIPALGGTGVMGVLLGVAVLAGSVLAVTPLVRLAIVPFRSLFQTHTAVSRHALVGRRCILTTQTVSESFGQAEIADTGAGHLVEVRCREPNTLEKGSEAIVYEYDAANELFRIAPLDEVPSDPQTPPSGAPE